MARAFGVPNPPADAASVGSGGWVLRAAGAMPWALLAIVFGLILGSGAWLLAGIVIGALLAGLLLASGPWWVAMGWMVLSPTVAVFLNDMLQGIPFFRTERVVFLLLLGYFAAAVVFRKQRLPALGPAERCMAAFLLLGLAHVLFSLTRKPVGVWSKEDAALLFDGYLMPMGAFYIARRLDWTEARALRFLWMMGAAALFLALTAPLETMLGIKWFIPNYLDVIHVLLRATGTFGNAAAYGAVMGSMLLLVGLLYTQTPADGRRVALMALLLAVLGAIVLSKTRAAWVGVAVGLAVVFVRDPRSRPMLSVLALGIGLGAVIAVPLLLATRGFEERVLETAPIYNRIAGSGTAINMMLQNPLTGVGLTRAGFGQNRGQYAIEVGEVSAAWIRELAVPHNEFLNVGAMTGLIGFVLYLRVFAAVFRGLRRVGQDAAQRPFTRAFAAYATALWVGWCINACFADFANLGYVNILLYFTAGVVAALAAAPGERSSADQRSGSPAPM